MGLLPLHTLLLTNYKKTLKTLYSEYHTMY